MPASPPAGEAGMAAGAGHWVDRPARECQPSHQRGGDDGRGEKTARRPHFA